MGVDLLKHNQETYENICRMYGEGIQRVAVVQPTGSGKSLLMAKLIEDNPSGRFFILSTSHKINDQFKSKLDDETLRRVDFNIYYNMPNMKQEVMESLQPDYILLDEMHRALAKEWSKGINVLLKMYPDAKVLGLSATPIRYLDRCKNVVNELFGGNIACDMSLSQAILDGILPMARYVCGVYSYKKDTESLNKRIEASCNSDEEKKELLEQVKVLKQNLDKANGVSEIIKKYVASGNEKFVVFLKNTTHLREMKPVIEKWFTDAGFATRLYEVHCKNAERDKEFIAFKEDSQEGIKLCLSVNMIAEGIHGDIDGVIMLRDTTSPNFYFQMIGRAFSCGKKTIPLIFDLVANSQFISDAVDNFPNELRGEIEKRKEECEKEGKEYEVGFDIDEFIVMDYFMDVVSGFRAIERRLQGRDWENGLKHFDKYVREHDGDVLVPENYKDADGYCTGQWTSLKRKDFRNERLSFEKIEDLEKRGFVWDVLRLKFENNVNDCLRFYNTYNKLPSKESSDKNEKKLGLFIANSKNYINSKGYPQWKLDLLKQIPGFFEKKEKLSFFDNFYNMVLKYKKKCANVEIKKGIIVDGYDLYQGYYYLKSKSNKLTNEQLEMLKNVGIDFSVNKIQEMRIQKLQIAKQAIKEGVIINAQNQTYRDINFYTWKSTHLKDFTKEELEIMNKLVPNPGCMKPVKVVDIKNGKNYVYQSLHDAGKALYSQFHIVGSDKNGIGIIIKRLRGERKNMVYKGRFMFYYATDEEMKKYLEDNKGS